VISSRSSSVIITPNVRTESLRKFVPPWQLRLRGELNFKARGLLSARLKRRSPLPAVNCSFCSKAHYSLKSLSTQFRALNQIRYLNLCSYKCAVFFLRSTVSASRENRPPVLKLSRTRILVDEPCRRCVPHIQPPIIRYAACTENRPLSAVSVRIRR